MSRRRTVEHDAYVCGVLVDNLEIKCSRLEVDPGAVLRDYEECGDDLSEIAGLNDIWAQNIHLNLFPAIVEIGGKHISATEESWALLDEIVEALRFFARGYIQVLGHYEIPKGWKRPKHSEWGSTASLCSCRPATFVLPSPKSKMIIDRIKCGEFPRFWTKWRNTPRESIKEALTAFKRVTAGISGERINALVQCHEALLSEGPGDLKYKIAMRGSFLLSEQNDNYTTWFDILKICYDIRSDIVHGKRQKYLDADLKKLEKLTEQAGYSLADFIDVFEEHTRTLIPKVAFASENKTREAYLRQIDHSILAGASRYQVNKCQSQ